MASDRSLFIHVGDHKTGSSFLQSCFAGSVPSLAAEGIHYPASGQLERSAEGGLSIGNPAPLMQIINDEPGSAEALQGLVGDGRGTLFSGEMLFITMMRRQGLPKIVAAARQAGFDKVRMLLFTRDPVSHCASLWQQSVKKGGNVNPIDRSALAFSRPHLAANFIQECQTEPDVVLTVRNYSVVRKNLRGAVTDWLGVPTEALVAPPIATVNRSLTNAELELQLALNRVLGRNLMLAGPLCEQLPDVRADETRPSLQAQELLWERLSPSIEIVNAIVEPEQRYRRDVDTSEPGGDVQLSMSPDQLRLIGGVLGAEIARLRIQVSGDLEQLDLYVAAEGDSPLTRRFLADYARTLQRGGDAEKAGEVRSRLAALQHSGGENSSPTSAPGGESAPAETMRLSRNARLEERRAARRVARRRPAAIEGQDTAG
jgi:hypothetical protein